MNCLLQMKAIRAHIAVVVSPRPARSVERAWNLNPSLHSLQCLVESFLPQARICATSGGAAHGTHNFNFASSLQPLLLLPSSSRPSADSSPKPTCTLFQTSKNTQKNVRYIRNAAGAYRNRPASRTLRLSSSDRRLRAPSQLHCDAR